MSEPYVQSSRDGDVLVLRLLPSELRETDMCYAVRDEMVGALKESTAKNVIIDMRNTRFVGSIGLLAFLALRRTSKDARIIVCDLDESIREMFIVCRLITTGESSSSPFESRPTFEEARAAFSD